MSLAVSGAPVAVKQSQEPVNKVKKTLCTTANITSAHYDGNENVSTERETCTSMLYQNMLQ
jgi:hypothetical protein